MANVNPPDDQQLAYFYTLIQNPLAPPPPGMDGDTADLVRRLVDSEKKAGNIPRENLEEAGERVWQRVMLQAAPRPANSAPKERYNRGPVLQVLDMYAPDNSRSSRIPGFASWSKKALVATMIVTVALVAGVIVLVMLNARSEDSVTSSRQTLEAGSANRTPTTSPNGYKITLKINSATPDPKQSKLTAQVIQDRIEGLGLSFSSLSVLEDKQLLEFEARGSIDEKLLYQIVTVPGRVEVIAVGREKLADGEQVQTSYCKTIPVFKPNQGSCLANKNSGSTNSAGDPFETLLTNDQNTPPGNLQSFLKELTNVSNKYLVSNPGTSLMFVVDGEVYAAVKIVNDGSPRDVVSLNPDNTTRGKNELLIITSLLNSGPHPVTVEITNSSRL